MLIYAYGRSFDVPERILRVKSHDERGGEDGHQNDPCEHPHQAKDAGGDGARGLVAIPETRPGVQFLGNFPWDRAGDQSVTLSVESARATNLKSRSGTDTHRPICYSQVV